MKFSQLLFILFFATAIQAQRNVVLIIADDLGADYFGFYEESLQLELVAEKGQILLKNELPQSSTICVFDTQTLYEGCYLLNISDGVSRKTFKVVVSR
jgi:hypothetical protein